MMQKELNPYEPPTDTDDRLGLWSRLIRKLVGDLPAKAKFSTKRPFMFDGVVFYRSAKSDSIVGAIALSKDEPDHRERCCNEVIRVLHELIAEESGAEAWAKGRDLVVSLVSNYRELDNEIGRETVPAEQWQRLTEEVV